MKVVKFAFSYCHLWTDEPFLARTMENMNEWALWSENYIVDLIVLLHEMDLSQQESHLFRQRIYHFISFDYRSSYKRNLLHMTCLMPTRMEIRHFTCWPKITGHISIFNTNVARIIINFGEHLDHANKFNTTVIERLKFTILTCKPWSIACYHWDAAVLESYAKIKLTFECFRQVSGGLYVNIKLFLWKPQYHNYRMIKSFFWRRKFRIIQTENTKKSVIVSSKNLAEKTMGKRNCGIYLFRNFVLPLKLVDKNYSKCVELLIYRIICQKTTVAKFNKK